MARRDLFLQACLQNIPPPPAEAPSQVKSRSYRCWRSVPLPSPRTIAEACERALSLHFLNDLPSSLASLCAWACEFLLAEAHGVGEDCQSCVEFAQHFVSRTGAILTCSVVLCCAQEADTGWYAKGSDVVPRGLSSLHFGWGEVPALCTETENDENMCSFTMSCSLMTSKEAHLCREPPSTATVHAFSVKY